MRGAARWALDLLYPPRCPGCHGAKGRGAFCRCCRERVEAPSSPLCPLCGIPFRTPLGADHPCARCLARPPVFASARACALYVTAEAEDNPLAAVLHRYKYGRDVTLAGVLADLLQSRCPREADYDRLVPVPLHPERLRWRGFNQSLLLARPLGRAWNVSVDPFVLRRSRSTRPQVGLDEAARRRNVGGAFTVGVDACVKGLSILLVDDVFTTGATVNECAATLRRAGAQRVDVLVLARALPH
jgi:ComF family protein